MACFSVTAKDLTVREVHCERTVYAARVGRP